MSTKISNLLFEENNIQNIHNAFKNNLLLEAKMPETQLKRIGKIVASQIKGKLPDLEAQLKDIENGVFDMQSLKKLSQSNLAGFNTDFVSSKKSKSEDQITGKQTAPTPIDFDKFDNVKMYPMIIKDKKSGQEIEGGKSGITYIQLFFIPAVGEVIKDQKIIDLHKEVFVIKEDIPDNHGLLHHDIKEIPHFPVTFEQLQVIQAELTSGSNFSKTTTILKAAKRIKPSESEVNNTEDEATTPDNDDSAEATVSPDGEVASIAAGVYESAIKGNLHKKDLSSLLFEKKSRLSKKDKIILEEVSNIKDEELLNEFIGKFKKSERDKRKKNKENKELKARLTKDFKNTLFTIYGDLPEKIDDILTRFYKKSPKEFEEKYTELKNTEGSIVKSKFDSAKIYLQAVMSKKKEINTEDVESPDFEELTSSYTSVASIDLSIKDEDEESPSFSQDDVKATIPKDILKDAKKIFDGNGNIIDNKRSDIKKDIKTAVDNLKNQIPAAFSEIKELFTDDINTDNISKAASNLVSTLKTQLGNLKVGKTKTEAAASELMKPFSIEGISKELKEAAQSDIDTFKANYIAASDKFIKSHEVAIASGEKIIAEIGKIGSQSGVFEVQGQKINSADVEVAKVLILLTAGNVLEFSKYCHALKVAYEDLTNGDAISANLKSYQDYFSLFAQDEVSGEDDDKDDEAIAKKQNEKNNKMSELNALFRVQSSLSKFGISPEDAKSMLSSGGSSKQQEQQLAASTLESVISIEAKSILNEATTTKASNPNIVNIAGKTIVNFDGSIDQVVLKAIYNNLDKDASYKKIKISIKEDLLALTGLKKFKEADADTVQDLLHSYFMSEFSNAGDLAHSMSSSPRISKMLSIAKTSVASAKSKAKSAIKIGIGTLWGTVKWGASTIGTLLTVGIATILGVGGLKLVASLVAGIPILSAISIPVNALITGLAGIYTAAAAAIGAPASASSLLGGMTLIGTSVQSLYTAMIGQYASASLSATAVKGSLAVVDPIANFIVQIFAYPLTAATGSFSWSGMWTAMTAGINNALTMSASTSITIGAKSGSSGLSTYMSTLWSSGSFSAASTAAKTAATSTAIKGAASTALPALFAGFWTKAAIASIALFGAYKIYKYMLSDEIDDVKIDDVVNEMLKVYILAAATNKDTDLISNILGITNPSDRSLITQNIKPTSNEINLITEFYNTDSTSGTSIKSMFDMSSVADLDGAKTNFREALNNFSASFEVFEGNVNHKRKSGGSDWFKNNPKFNSYLLSNTVDVRAFTIEKLRALYRELEKDLLLLSTGEVNFDKFKAHYNDGKILFIVKNFLEDGVDPNGQTFIRSNLSEIVTNKNDVIKLIESYRNQQLSNMSELFTGTPTIKDDPLLKILSKLKDSDDIDKVNMDINISNIIKNIDKHVTSDAINTQKILSILKSKAGGVTAGAIEKYFLEGNKIVQFSKGIFGQAEEQKYAKEWNEEISKVLAKSMEYCIDDLDVFKESKQHPIFLLKPVSREDFLSEGIIAEGPVLKALGITGMGAAASSYLYGAATGTSAATGLANAAIAWVGPATGLALGLNVGAIILGAIVAGTGAYMGLVGIKKMAKVFIDKIKSKVSFNPWEDNNFVKELMPMVKKAAQGLVAYKYMEIIYALKDKLEKIGVKVTGFDNPMFKGLNKKLADRKQISRIKNNLTKEGKELQGQFIDNMYKAKNALPREGLGKYLNQSTVDRFLDEILFGTNSPLAEVFKHSSMSDNDSSESFVYQKGLGLLLEDPSAQPKEVIISMNKLYSELADRVENFFKTDLNYNERVTVEIQKDIDHLMQRSGVDILRLPKRLSQKLGDLHIPLLKKGGKNANQYLVDAISNGTGLSNANLSKVISSQGIKLRESRLNQGDLLLEALHTHDLKLLVESDVVNQIWQKGSNIDIVGVSDSKRAATRWFSTDGGKTWAIDDISSVSSYTPPAGATDVTNTYNLSKLKTTYTSGPSASGTGPVSMNPSGGMIAAADGKAMGGFTPVLAPTSPSWITQGHSILTQSVVNNILQTCADIFQTGWMIDGVARMTNVMFGDTLTLSDTMNKLNDINWSLLPSKMFLATTLITLDSLKEELKQRGIVIQGEVPTDILSNFDAASSRNLGGAVKQKADIVSQLVLNKMGVKDKKKSKVNEKQLKRAVEQSLTDGILVYYKNFNRDKYDERMKRAELGADVEKRRTAVDSKKFMGTGLALGGTAAAIGLGVFATGGLGLLPLLGAGISTFAGSKIYNDAESGVDQLYASSDEFDSAVTKAERSMAAKEAASLADLLISFSKEVKGISNESIRLNNPNLLNTQYVHNNFDFRKLVNESRLNEITGNTNTIGIDDVLSRLRASGIMVFNGDIKRGTSEYKEALSHTVETVESMLKSFFDIQVTGAEKYKSSNFVQNVVKSAVDPNTKPGQPASSMVSQANNGTSPPSMNSNGNMNDMMQLANMSGGNNMMMFMMMMMMQMSGRSSGGMDIMQLMQQLNGGKLTIGDAAQKISEEEGMEGFADAIELAISEANGSKPAMSGVRVKQLYKAMNKNPLSKLKGFTLNSRFAKGSSINSKVFVEELKRYINIKEKAAKAIDSVDTVESIVVFLSNVFILEPSLRKAKGKYNSAEFGLDSIEQASTKEGSKISILGSYYLHLINSSDKKVLPFKIDDTTITFKDDSQWQQYFGIKPASDLEIKDVPEDFVKMLRSVNKFLSEEIQTESIRAKKQDVEILEERYYKKKLSSLLFEDKVVNNSVVRNKKNSKNEINLRQEWLNIWDI